MDNKKLPKGWLLGAILICGIITFVLIMLGDGFIELLSDIAFALIVAVIANGFLKNVGVARIPILIVVFIVATYVYGPVIEYALLSRSLIICLGLTMWPIWVVAVALYLSMITKKNSSEVKDNGDGNGENDA
jgi:hypothetical protein